MIPSNKNFIKNIFNSGDEGSLFLKSEDIPANTTLIILDIAAAIRGIMIEPSLIRNMFSNHTKYTIPYASIKNNSTTYASYTIEYTTLDGVPSIKFAGAINIYFFE